MSASSAFKHIVLWTSNPDKFFCVEPWMALPDGVHRDAVWLKKDIEFALKLSW
jgi:galactose mutarotase-like enzyme